MPKVYKIFLDTSSLLSGLNSPQGASGILVSLFRLKRIEVAISPEVVVEAERAIKNKFPDLGITFLDFISHKPFMTSPIKPKELRSAYKIIKSEDTPIYAGALKSHADFLVTLDKRFEHLALGSGKIKVLSSGAFLKIYKQISL